VLHNIVHATIMPSAGTVSALYQLAAKHKIGAGAVAYQLICQAITTG
jgi:hypothetical protein